MLLHDFLDFHAREYGDEAIIQFVKTQMASSQSDASMA